MMAEEGIINSSSMVVNDREEEAMDLPPGFRFHPTDEEILTHYLAKKVMDQRLKTIAMGEVDMNKCEPWDLPQKAKMWGVKEWFFFSKKDRKYPTGMRTNRATSTGYWKATGKDREIYNKRKGFLIGMKKTLVFYIGRAPKGDKSNWVMHEYRLHEGKLSYYNNFPRGAKEEWVVCKIFHKNSSGIGMKTNLYGDNDLIASKDSNFHDNTPTNLPPLVDEDIIHKQTSSSFTHDDDYEEEQQFKQEEQVVFPSTSSYFTNNNSNLLQFQPHQTNNFFINPSNYYANGSITYHPSSDPPAVQQNPIFFDYQQPTSECTNPGGNLQQHCKIEQFSSNNSMVSPLSQGTTEISSGLTNRAASEFGGDVEGISVRHDMEYFDNLWDY